ncbi:MAG: DUF1987 domain-containing protein [Bacteroidota bacterium]|jgi:SiaC family regulatory phosphoprotein
MNLLVREATTKSPSVSFDPTTGILELKGRSIPENALEFYKPLMDWIDSWTQSSPAKTEMHVQLEYFNTSSSKCLLDLFKRLEKLDSKAVVVWKYETDDEDMLEAGEDYEAILSVPFEMREV